MPEIKLRGWMCTRCNHRWIPRKDTIPVKCPRCGSPYWNIPKKERCTFCGKEITDGEGIVLDESAVDGVFCSNVCAEAYICKSVEAVAKENSQERKND